MKKIIFPRQCDNDIKSYQRVFQSYSEAFQSNSEDVYIDCGDIEFLRPLGLNVLAAIIRMLLRSREAKVYWCEPKPVCAQYIRDQGFYEEFIVKDSVVGTVPRSTSVALRHMEVFDGTYFDQVASWLNRNSILPEQAIGDLVKITLSELINNVLDHSRSPIGCYLSAQAYPQEGRLLFSVVDFGVGFLNTVSSKYPQVATSEEAIALAVQPGVTCQSRGGNAGAGLDILSGFIKHYGGILEIISMEGKWLQESDGSHRTQSMPFTLPGTCINLKFKNEKIISQFKQDESYD